MISAVLMLFLCRQINAILSIFKNSEKQNDNFGGIVQHFPSLQGNKIILGNK